MSDKPIIFSAPMVRALLEGRKTQTRRVVRQPDVDAGQHWHRYPAGWFMIDEDDAYLAKTPYQTGDRLYVREAHKLIDRCCDYRADWPEATQRMFRWRPSIHMPRWASRLTLTVTDVRVQRLQEISEADAMAEGGVGENGEEPCGEGYRDAFWVNHGQAHGKSFSTARDSFRDLWNSLHGPEAWDANPWVAAYTFRPVLGNIDMLAERARQ